MKEIISNEDWYSLTSEGITSIREVTKKIEDLRNTILNKTEICYEQKLALDCLDNCRYMFYETIKRQQKR